MISLDLANNTVTGNLADDENINYWMHLCKSKVVVGFLAGPPCETWSSARFIQAEPGQPPLPPPVRSSVLPWGLPDLTLAQYRQIQTGSKLLQSVILFFAAMLHTGGFGLAEHPAQDRSREQAPSIYKLCYVRWMLESPACERIKFNQGLHGAASQKPTELIVLRMPTIRDRVSKFQGGEVKTRVGTLQGLDDNGVFKTAAGKQYPESLCRAFALAIADNLQQQEGRYDAEHDDFDS